MHITISMVVAYYCLQTSLAKRGRRVDIFQQDGGDIAQMRRIDNGRHSSILFNALSKQSQYKWNRIKDGQGNYVIPYNISGQFDQSEQDIITSAMKTIESNSCVRFRSRKDENDYIDIENQANEGCYSNVGRMPGRNVLMLEANRVSTCVEADIVIHELFHSLGLWHEHMRYDRDDFIKVHFENIGQVYFSQFEMVPESQSTTYGVKYDYRSVMHYSKTAFASKPGLITMETKDPAYQDVIGTVKAAAPSDWTKICAIYNCEQCMSTTAIVPLINVSTSVSSSTTIPPRTTSPKPTECIDRLGPFCRMMITEKSGRMTCTLFDNRMQTWCCATCKRLTTDRRKPSLPFRRRIQQGRWEWEDNHEQ